MVEFGTLRDRPDKQPIGNAVRKHRATLLTADPDAPIALVADRSLPNPTTVLIHDVFLGESLGK
jgi:fructose-specific component phosphotransferase system IIB-like protein